MASIATLRANDATRLAAVPRTDRVDTRLSPRAALATWLLLSAAGWAAIAAALTLV